MRTATVTCNNRTSICRVTICLVGLESTQIAVTFGMGKNRTFIFTSTDDNRSRRLTMHREFLIFQFQGQDANSANIRRTIRRAFVVLETLTA